MCVCLFYSVDVNREENDWNQQRVSSMFWKLHLSQAFTMCAYILLQVYQTLCLRIWGEVSVEMPIMSGDVW